MALPGDSVEPSLKKNLTSTAVKRTMFMTQKRRSFDPRADAIRTSGKDRRKFNDPNYKGPERRLERKRKSEIDRILRTLEDQLGPE
jgi:hypothetical protein